MESKCEKREPDTILFQEIQVLVRTPFSFVVLFHKRRMYEFLLRELPSCVIMFRFNFRARFLLYFDYYISWFGSCRCVVVSGK